MAAKRYVIEALGAQHQRATFDSGVEALDRYLRQQASQYSRNNVARCFVLVDPEGSHILGYYTLSAFGIETRALPVDVTRRLPRYTLIPAILLGRLAVDRRYHGSGHGGRLLVSALARSLTLSAEVAAFAVVVEAKDDAARAFYERYDFIPFPEQPSRLYLPMRTIAQSFASAG